MILITGATGKLGKSLIDFLLREIQPEQIAALVRDPQKTDPLVSRGVGIRKGDYEDYNSLLKAFEGAEKLVFISTSVTGEVRNRQHGNVVKAAKEAGVHHVYYTSIVNPSENAVFSATPGHFLTEKGIRESGMSYTFFRNNLYMDLVPALIGDAAENGTLYFAAGNQRAGFVLREDIADALARVVLADSRENKTYNISPPETYSFVDVAVALGKAVGKSIKYEAISTKEMEVAMKQGGVPESIISITTNMADALQKGEFDTPDTTLSKLLGREPVHLETFMRQFYSM